MDATLGLHVVSCGAGLWGQVEDLPVDVYYCDFAQYDPPEGFPERDVCCIRTQGAWWIILTQAVFDLLQQLAQDGELALGLEQTLTAINERQIGAWILVRDQAVTAEQALEQMDEYLFGKYGPDYASVQSILAGEATEDQEETYFAERSFGTEPLEVDELEDVTAVLDGALDAKPRTARRSIRVGRVLAKFRRWGVAQRVKVSVVLVLLLGVLVLEGPRLSRFTADVYGPSSVDLKASFPRVRWIDRTADSVLSTPRVSRSLFQALTHRNPFKPVDSIVEVSVRDMLLPDESKVYRWKILCDETGPQDEIAAQMPHLSRKEMRGLQNSLSGYRSLRFIMAYKLLMCWGHNGRFIVVFTGLCLGVLVLLVRRLLKRVQSIQSDMSVRDEAAGGKILESLAQDTQAAENLMRFNQDRRLRMQGKGAAASWEKQTFEWVEHHVDPATGKTKRKLRDEHLAEKRGAGRS